MRKYTIFLMISLLLVSASVSFAQDETTLTVVTHDSFAVSEDLLVQFEQETGITVRILRSGDAGTMVNQSILSRSNPLGDVMYGVDNTFLSRALNADLFMPFQSPMLEHVREEFLLDNDNRVTPVNFGDVCLNYDVEYFEHNNLPVPQSLLELTDPIYAGLLVVENPANSSPGLAFLLATIAEFGEDGDYTYLDFWADLVENDVFVSDDWSDAYFAQFTVPSGGLGSRPIVVSYASSPPAEVFFAEDIPEFALTASIIADGTCFRQIEFVGILAGTENIEAAQDWVNFMLSPEFQEDLPLQMFVFPVIEDTELPDVFQDFALIPEKPALSSIEEIDAKRDTWIMEWVELVLR